MDSTNLPKVSVLLPFKGGESTIGIAIQSILSQSYADFELLLLDDGSSERCLQIVKGFSDRRVRLISDGVNCGLAFRLNQGIELARGEYIARMDADDVSFPNRFSAQVEYLDQNPHIDLVGTRVIVFKGPGTIIGSLPFASTHAAICANPWRNLPLPHPTWMGRTVWFRKHKYKMPEVVRAEDQELLLRASHSSQYACLDQIHLGYRQGPFRYSLTIAARKSLLVAQANHFFRHREYLNLTCAGIVTALKVVTDTILSLPFFAPLFFWRMRGEVDQSARSALSVALRANGGSAK